MIDELAFFLVYWRHCLDWLLFGWFSLGLAWRLHISYLASIHNQNQYHHSDTKYNQSRIRNSIRYDVQRQSQNPKHCPN